MPGKKSTHKSSEWKDISSQVGFFYSPVERNSTPRRVVRSSSHRQHHSNCKFAQSNFRLILNNLCDESKYVDAIGEEVEWEDVVSVEWTMEKEDCCPLCLMPYTAPRVCSCGHCFCYACIKQYLTLQPDSWVKCPVCSVLFDEHSLRPVRIFSTTKEISVGDIVPMDLVIRPIQSVNAFSPANPRLSYYLKHRIPNADLPEEDIQYCHLLYNTPYYELSLLKENLQELDRCEIEMNEVGEMYLFGSMHFIRDEINSRIEVLNICNHSIIQPTSLPYSESTILSDVYYYYTLPWRLSYHLLPLTFQCIRSYYGSYEKCPSHIQSKVLEIEDIEVTTYSCSIDKSLQHSPLHSIIHYLELDIHSIIPDKIEKGLWEQIKKREMDRKIEKRQMRKEEKRIDRKVKKEQLQYFEEYAPYMLGEEEEQPNMTDSNAFPSLPAKQEKEVNPKTKSIWAEPSKSIIGVNSSLKNRLDSGQFPSLGQSPPTQSKPVMKWGKVANSSSSESSKKKEKKKPVTILSFSLVYFTIHDLFLIDDSLISFSVHISLSNYIEGKQIKYHHYK